MTISPTIGACKATRADACLSLLDNTYCIVVTTLLTAITLLDTEHCCSGLFYRVRSRGGGRLRVWHIALCWGG